MRLPPGAQRLYKIGPDLSASLSLAGGNSQPHPSGSKIAGEQPAARVSYNKTTFALLTKMAIDAYSDGSVGKEFFIDLIRHLQG
jgi:hypothetical protein